MSGDKRRAAMDGRLSISARLIVLGGVCSLFMVLLGTMTMGIGTDFNIGMGLLFSSLIGIILVLYRRGTGSER
jgi:hypothetical protein